MLSLWLSGVTCAAVQAQEHNDGQAGRSEFDLRLRLGASGYTGGLADIVEVGPLLGLTVDGRGDSAIGFEASYDGVRNAVSDDYIATAGSIWQHTVSVLVKGGPTFDAFSPFVAAGVGGSYVDVTDQAAMEGFKVDVLAEVPVALGLEWRLGAVSAGVRGTYRLMFSEDFAEETSGPGVAPATPSGNALAGTVSVGGRF